MGLGCLLSVYSSGWVGRVRPRRLDWEAAAGSLKPPQRKVSSGMAPAFPPLSVQAKLLVLLSVPSLCFPPVHSIPKLPPHFPSWITSQGAKEQSDPGVIWPCPLPRGFLLKHLEQHAHPDYLDRFGAPVCHPLRGTSPVALLSLSLVQHLAWCLLACNRKDLSDGRRMR